MSRYPKNRPKKIRLSELSKTFLFGREHNASLIIEVNSLTRQSDIPLSDCFVNSGEEW